MTIDQLIEHRSHESNFYVHPCTPKRAVCVLRCVGGTFQALMIPANSYREYVGCFSLLKVK